MDFPGPALEWAILFYFCCPWPPPFYIKKNKKPGEWITPAVEPSLRAGEGGEAGAVDDIKSTNQNRQATKEE